jgi:hypothetical protein
MENTKQFTGKWSALSFAFATYFRSFVFMVRYPQIMLTALLSGTGLSILIVSVMIPIFKVAYHVGLHALIGSLFLGTLITTFLICIYSLAVTRTTSNALLGREHGVTADIKHAFYNLPTYLLITLILGFIYIATTVLFVALPLAATASQLGLTMQTLQGNYQAIGALGAVGLLGLAIPVTLGLYLLIPLSAFSPSVIAIADGNISNAWNFYKKTPYQIPQTIGVMLAGSVLALALWPVTSILFRDIPVIKLTVQFITGCAVVITYTTLYHRMTRRSLKRF